MPTRRDLLRATAAFPTLGALPAFGTSASRLTCEPLAGHFTHETVRLWIQADDSVKAAVAFKPVKGAPDATDTITSVQLESSRANPRLVAELAVEQRNFGTLEFTGSGDKRRMIASCFDANGKQFWQRTLSSAKTDASGEPI